ncbi:MAG: Methyltransferase family protein [uncultured Aureispira sp.]|uniref:Methyltransferase family protein n=1 Tax=uncultured Aureispira sp. TaxID=1331704 RepID=A0A6S6UHZ8_9BACT|nr:MAG: Methyltransferase family protein [uncultured Aureispira sp.]
MNLRDQVGNIDIYLLDQILKGRYDNGQRVLDAGCGGGRNLAYFLKEKWAVYGVDQNAEAVAAVQSLSKELFPQNPSTNFRVESVENLSFDANFFDVVICNAVLHFAENKAHFEAMLQSTWRVLKPGGHLFVRLASSIGIENRIIPLEQGRFLLPDESVRFLVDESTLLKYTKELDGILTEYIKTTNVQGLRCMTTWCLQKR